MSVITESPVMPSPGQVLPPDVKDLLPKVELLETDGEPLETNWHRKAMNLLIEQVEVRYTGRTDYYVGGNMFIYYSEAQAEDIARHKEKTTAYRGPDFFFVKGVNRHPQRSYWVVWKEGGRYPDVIIELLSHTTAKTDRTTKKDLYEQTFHTHEYFCYDPETQRLDGWRLINNRYETIQPNERGWLWSEELQLWVGTWVGTFMNDEMVWLRFYDTEGNPIPLEGELARRQAAEERQRAEAEKQRAEAEKQRAEAEKQRAEAAEAEVVRLKALLAEKGGSTARKGPAIE